MTLSPGTCQEAGGNSASFNGSIFKITPDGTITGLYGFAGTNNGFSPFGGLVQAPNGVLYGTTEMGGTNGNYGTIFEITTNGAFTNLFSFNKTNGAFPYASMVLGPNGNLYGTTESGGTNEFNNSGTVFRITPAGQFTLMASFGGALDGASVYGGLVLGTNGLFYGTTYSGGDEEGDGEGTIYQMDTNGNLTTLYSFDVNASYVYADGHSPQDALVQGTDGNFYGTTTGGGAYNKGTVFSFSLTPPVVAAPVFQSVSQAGGLLTFTWSAVSNANYQVQYSTDLTQNNWTNLDRLVLATNSLMSGQDLLGPDNQRFYRVMVAP